MAVAVEDSAEGFAERMIGVLNDGMLGLMISVGHRTGLFDAMAAAGPLSSAVIAERASLNERYVREWLGAMTTGRIVEYDPTTSQYTLPDDRAAALTRAAGLGNLAATMQLLGLLSSVEGQVVRSFREGGGVRYEEYHDFQRLMAEDSAAIFDATLLDVTLPLVPGITDRLRAGIDVADVGCGSGHALNLMAQAYPASRFLGFDISAEGLAAGRREAAARGLTNVTFEQHDAAAIDAVEAFDFITTFDSVHDQARPDLVLAAIRRALRPGGLYLCVDVQASSDLEANLDHPMGTFLYAVSAMHCMTV